MGNRTKVGADSRWASVARPDDSLRSPSRAVVVRSISQTRARWPLRPRDRSAASFKERNHFDGFGRTGSHRIQRAEHQGAESSVLDAANRAATGDAAEADAVSGVRRRARSAARVPIEFGLSASPSEREHARDLLKDAPRPRLGVILGSSWPSRIYFPKSIAAVIRGVCDRNNVNGDGPALFPVLLGGPDETALASEVMRELGGIDALNLAGKTSLRDLIAIFSECDAAFGPDSGPMHIAAAVGCPIVSLWGATSPKRSAPWGFDDFAIAGDIPCHPCYLRNCPVGRECMHRIAPETVIEALRRARSARGIGAKKKSLRPRRPAESRDESLAGKALDVAGWTFVIPESSRDQSPTFATNWSTDVMAALGGQTWRAISPLASRDNLEGSDRGPERRTEGHFRQATRCRARPGCAREGKVACQAFRACSADLRRPAPPRFWRARAFYSSARIVTPAMK